ncbi:MAG: GTPase HflX [Anaerolineales bacterium]
MTKATKPTVRPKERAFLVGVEWSQKPAALTLRASLQELALLSHTAGLVVVGYATQKLDHPDRKTFIGSGKVEEVKHLAADKMADIILFDDELSPRHQRELERALGDDVRVLDRTALILDIFAQHADTREGALQVELAQYEYRLPRLTRAWTHLARQAGGGAGRSGSVGGVGLRGPGETQLEVDRREIGRRIAHLQEELEKVRAHRSRYRARRRRSKIATVALVGYTNAGKSTLLNRLSDADVFVADQLFATLDPTTRRVELPAGQQVLVTDTVGFIQKLPTMLVAAFRATLEEIVDANLLLHVVDITHPQAQAQAQSVRQTLAEIGAGDLPLVTALNKIDLLQEDQQVFQAVDDYERAVPISAVAGTGIPTLLRTIEQVLFESLIEVTVEIPYRQGSLISHFHEVSTVLSTDHGEESVRMRGRLPAHFADDFDAFITGDADPSETGIQAAE